VLPTPLAIYTLPMSHQEFSLPSERGDMHASENTRQPHLTSEKINQSKCGIIKRHIEIMNGREVRNLKLAKGNSLSSKIRLQTRAREQ